MKGQAHIYITSPLSNREIMALQDIRTAVSLILEADNFYKHVYKVKLNQFLKMCVNQETDNEYQDEIKEAMEAWIKVSGYVPKESSMVQQQVMKILQGPKDKKKKKEEKGKEEKTEKKKKKHEESEPEEPVKKKKHAESEDETPKKKKKSKEKEKEESDIPVEKKHKKSKSTVREVEESEEIVRPKSSRTKQKQQKYEEEQEYERFDSPQPKIEEKPQNVKKSRART